MDEENQHHLLIVEDNLNFGMTLYEYLCGLDFSCSYAKDCQSARKHFYHGRPPSVVLMDVGLPDGSGIELAAEFRRQRKDFVFLFMSAQNDPHLRLEGLELGAEDFITRPFALKELMLRLRRALLGHVGIMATPDVYTHGSLKIFFKRYEVCDGYGQIHALSHKECYILKILYQKKNQVVARDEIIERVWGENAFPSNRTVDNYIVKLRKWCSTDAHDSLGIQSVRGVGYKLNVRDERSVSDGIV